MKDAPLKQSLQNLEETVPVFPEKYVIILVSKKLVPQAEVSMPADTDFPAENFKSVGNAPIKDFLLFVKTVNTVIPYAVSLKLKSVRNFLLRLMSVTVVLNATLPVLWKNDFISLWMHGKNIRKSFPKHAVASHFPKKRFPIWMKSSLR